MNTFEPYNNLLEQVAYKTLHLLVERKATLNDAGVVFYVWPRGARLIVAFDPSAIDTERVNDDFTHRLSTRLRGRRVVRTNSRGLFLQVGIDIPAAPRPLESLRLDLSLQPTAWHIPVGMTADGPLWISLLDGDSFLIGGSRGNGKTGEEHAWVQALLRGGKTLVYAWDGKRGAEFGRYVGMENFHIMLNGMDGLLELQAILKDRERMLTESGYPNIVMYNEAQRGTSLILPIALFVDEAADLPDQAKDLLKSMIRLYRHAGLYPIIATNQPTQAEVFAKTNLSTRVAFRVPHHNDSVTMLGYKGAEALPDVRGRGLIVWKGRFVEFQSFQVGYPMPTEEGRRLLSESNSQNTNDSAKPPPADEIAARDLRIWDMHLEGKSQAEIERTIFGHKGGNAANKVSEVIKRYKNAATTGQDAPKQVVLSGDLGIATGSAV
jgi:hypothetical protein